MMKKIALLFSMLLVLIAASMTCSAGELLKKTDFKDNFSLPWRLYETNGQSSYLFVRYDRLIVHMDQKGTSKEDIKLSHKDISIVAGNTYSVKFSITADKDCKVYARIGDCEEPYLDAWNNGNEPISISAGRTLTVNQTFIPEKSIESAEFTFYLGGEMAGSLPCEIGFNIISLVDPEFITTPTPNPIPLVDIRVNQLGYFPYAAKKATVKVNRGATLVDWQLKDNKGNIVANGKTLPYGPDHEANEDVQIIDFSDYKKPGKAYQLVAGNAISFPFDIGTDMYSEMKYDALKYFYHARSGIEIEMPYCVKSSWTRAAGHTDDTAALITDRNYNGPKTIDGTGGWYDAGDHGKYVVHGGLALWILQNQYEHLVEEGRDGVFADRTLNIPESGNGKSDLMDETRWEMEWMLKMQIPEGFDRAGMAVHKLADDKWTPLATRPDQDKEKRIYYPPSTAATLNLSACAAQSSRIWRGVDSAFSSKCLAAAETAYMAAKKNPAVLSPYGQEPGSETYGDNYVEDEFYWAACELYVTTGKKEYLDDLKAYKASLQMPVTLTGQSDGIAGCFNWGATGGLGTLTLALHRVNEFPEVIGSIKKAADTFIAVQSKEGYGIPISESTYINEYDGQNEEITGYPFGSNGFILNEAIVMAYAYDLSGDARYFNGLSETMDYLMGRNPMVKVYVSGYGENPMKNPYHRFFCSQMDLLYPSVPPGFIASGPNSGMISPWSVGGFKNTQPAAQICYVDHVESRHTNQVSISLNAALAWVTCYMDKDLGPPPIVTPATTIPTLPGVAEDINKDGAVNMSDVVIIAKAFGSISGEDIFDKRCDLNYDGVINMVDVMRFALKFGFVYENSI